MRLGELVERFGIEVGELVAALTEDEMIDDWTQRKDDLRLQVAAAGADAVAIYAADKVANLQVMRVIYASHGEAAIDLHRAPTLDLRIEAWARDLELVEAGSGPELAAALRAELGACEHQRLQETATAQEAWSRG